MARRESDWHREGRAFREARLEVQAGLSRQHQAFFIGAPQQFVNFGDVFPHFVHLNWSAIACHLLPATASENDVGCGRSAATEAAAPTMPLGRAPRLRARTERTPGSSGPARCLPA